MKLQAYHIEPSDVHSETRPLSAPWPLEVMTWELSETNSVPAKRPMLEVLIRRGIDLFGSIILLALLAPIFFVLALIVLTDSPGGVLFMQRRVGKDGEEFWVYKLRSMIADAEGRRIALEQHNEASGPLFKMKQDPRVTRCGRWMRRYSLDELPQLLNVLRGEMSLVGPRPALPGEVAQYGPWERQRLCVKPGMTGLWQVSGRSALSFDQSIDLDITYVQQQSIWMDITIMLKTFKAVITGHGAY